MAGRVASSLPSSMNRISQFSEMLSRIGMTRPRKGEMLCSSFRTGTTIETRGASTAETLPSEWPKATSGFRIDQPSCLPPLQEAGIQDRRNVERSLFRDHSARHGRTHASPTKACLEIGASDMSLIGRFIDQILPVGSITIIESD